MTVDIYDPQIDAAGRKWNVNPAVIKTAMHLESSGNPNVEDSNAEPEHAVGLMQFLPSTAAGLPGPQRNPRVAADAIDLAGQYLAQGRDATGTVPGMLAYYHGGPDRAQWGPKTAAYVAKGMEMLPTMAVTPAKAAPSKATTPSELSGEDIFQKLTGGQTAAPSAGGSDDAAVMSGQDIFKALTQGAEPSTATPQQNAVGAINNVNLGDLGLPGLTGQPEQPLSDTAAGRAAAPVVQAVTTAATPTPNQNTTDAQRAATAAAAAPTNLDDLGLPGVTNTPAPPTVLDRTLGAGVQGAVAGAVNGATAPQEDFTTPATQTWLARNMPGVAVLGNALGGAAHLAIAGGNALIGGSLAGVAGAGNAIAPGLGNEAAGLGEYLLADAARKGAPAPRIPTEAELAAAPANRLLTPAETANAALDAQRVAATTNRLTGNVGPVPDVANVNAIGPSAARDAADLVRARDAAGPEAPPPGTPLLNKITAAIKGADATPAPVVAPVAAPAGLPTAPVQLEMTARAPDAAPAAGAPAPNSVGAAATPSELTNMSPEQAAEYRSTAERAKLLEPQPAGQDTTNYIPGVVPTEAQMVQDARTSRNEKLLEQQMPSEYKALAAANNETRSNYLQDMAGTEVTSGNMTRELEEAADQARTRIFANAGEADAQPVVDAAHAILQGPEGKLGPVKSSIARVLDNLTDASGNLETDPAQLYGVRKDINLMVSKEMARTDPTSTYAVPQLLKLRDALDQQIEHAAPGFGQYLQNYSEAMRPIEAQSVLREYLKPGKAFDTQSRVTYSGVQRMMNDIVQARRAKGVNPYKSLTDEQMTDLWALRDDLRRVASSDDLARAKGSDTAQNITDIMRKLAGTGIEAAAHGLAGYVAPVVGNLGVNMVKGRMARSALQRDVTRSIDYSKSRLTPRPTDLP